MKVLFNVSFVLLLGKTITIYLANALGHSERVKISLYQISFPLETNNQRIAIAALTSPNPYELINEW